jgi:NitT/TauT family transport system substrate-binding protein
VLTPAFKEITFTADPDAASFTADAQQAKEVGLLNSADLSGIFDLTPLNSLLTAAGEASVSAG